MQVYKVLPSPNYPYIEHPLASRKAIEWDELAGRLKEPTGERLIKNDKEWNRLGTRGADLEVSERIAELAKDHTQSEIASKMGVGADTVSRLFNEPSGATLENVTKFLSVLGCTVEQLRGEDGPRPSEEISSMYDALSDTSRDMVSKLVQRLWGFEHLS